MPAPSTAATWLPRLALAAIVTNAGIVVTGGIVRVTGSGLGCPDWPTCEGTRIVPTAAAGAGWHQAIEFGNRLLTFVVLAVAVAVWLAARRAAADRPHVRRLAAALPLGVLAQAVLGGITVLTGLHPLTVAAHFLLSAVLIAVAVALHHAVRAREPDDGAAGGAHDAGVAATADRRRIHRLASVLLVLAAAVLVLGTIVTASGPHAGDPETERLALDIRTVVRFHSTAVWLTVAATLAVWWRARRANEPRVERAAAVLLGVEVLQGTVGYVQYALGIPAALVAVHLLLATVFWVAVVRVWLEARAVAPVVTPSVRAAVAAS